MHNISTICIKITQQHCNKQHFLHKNSTFHHAMANLQRKFYRYFSKKCLLEPKCLIALLLCYTTLMMSGLQHMGFKCLFPYRYAKANKIKQTPLCVHCCYKMYSYVVFTCPLSPGTEGCAAALSYERRSSSHS